MAARSVHFADETRRRILRGAVQVARVAELTLGPDARAVLIGAAAGRPAVAASGYDVALNIEPACPVERIGAQAMRNLAWEMTDRWSDGSATAISLAAALLAELNRSLQAGQTMAQAQRETDALVEGAVTCLHGCAQPADDHAALLAVAQSAAGGDEAIAGMAADAALAVGPEGYIEVLAGGSKDEVDVSAGAQFETGLLSAAFATDAVARKAVLNQAHIVVFDGRIDDFGEIAPMLDVFARLGKPLLFAASALTPAAVGNLSAYVRQSGARIAAVQAPHEGVWKKFALGDIAASTGATVFGDEGGYSLSRVKPDLVGFAERVEIDSRRMRLIGGRSDPQMLAFRKGLIESDIRATRYLSLDRERHRRRLAQLCAGVATLRIAEGFSALRDRRLAQAKQAAGAVMASRSSGMVAGGGAALRDAAAHLAAPGGAARALAAPYRAIAANGGCTTPAAAGLCDPCEIMADALRKAAASALMLASANVSVTGAAKAGAA